MTRADRLASVSMMLAALVSAFGCAPTVGTTPAGGSAMPTSIMEPYLAIQTALADDSTDNVQMNAGNIVTASTALGAPAMKIDQAALQLAAAAEAAPPDIEKVREKFGLLSEAMDTYMTGLKLTGGEGVRVAWCPMVNKPWLQKGDALANPYYGKEMLTCGNFR
ncbi:MAG TPA: hypothetical protein VF219_10460 [Vicinamibacterales bacterium]